MKTEALIAGLGLTLKDMRREILMELKDFIREEITAAVSGLALKSDVEALSVGINTNARLAEFAERTIAQRLESLPVPVSTPGAEGAMGPSGPPGPQGPAGEPGAIGPEGPQGLAGPMGPEGTPGERGLDGALGLRGEMGPQGTPGIQGLAGLDGAPGPAGLQGPPGEIGLSGPQGPPGAAGEQGLQGSPGPAGQEGPRGLQGEMSAPVDVLDGQQYAEGTIGLWGGGVWYARRLTVGNPETDASWKLMVEGVRDIIAERTEDGVHFEIMLSSGTIRGHDFTLPKVVHLGAWKEDTQYLELQEVAWNGATWRAIRDTLSEPPSDDWRLVSQKGKSGPRGEAGPVGLQGVPGREGRGVGHIGWEGKGFAVTLTDGTVIPVIPEGLGDE